MKHFSNMCFPEFKRKAVTLSYDDGTIHDRTLIEIMSRYGLKGTFNINSGWILGGHKNVITPDEVKSLYIDTGNEIAVHGVEHKSLAEIDSAQGAYDVLQDRVNLEKMVGAVVKGMAYANGSFDDRVVEVLKTCGIEYARTTFSTQDFSIPTDWLRLNPTCHHKDARLMEHAERLANCANEGGHFELKPKLLYVWGHSYEFNNNNNWGIIENFAKTVGNKSDIYYATNGEIYSYVKAFESLRFSADNTFVHNPSAIDVYLYINKKEIIAKAGKTVEI